MTSNGSICMLQVVSLLACTLGMHCSSSNSSTYTYGQQRTDSKSHLQTFSAKLAESLALTSGMKVPKHKNNLLGPFCFPASFSSNTTGIEGFVAVIKHAA